MLRVSKSLRYAANLVLCAAAVGCSSGSDDGGDSRILNPSLIQFPIMYSAFDGNAHDYQISPWIPLAGADAATGADPVKPETIKWTVDSAYVQEVGDIALPGGRVFKTLKSGTTIVSVTADTVLGQKFKGEAQLNIEQADAADWEKGDMRYNNGVAIDPTMLSAEMAAEGSAGTCGLPIDAMGMIPTDSACTNCHNSMSPISVQHTPTQTAGYSGDQLIAIFTEALKPAGAKFNSPFLKIFTPEMAECLYKGFHTWNIPEDVREGIVLKLRSITPAPQSDIDIQAIAAAARAMQAANAGAAGGGS